jgi:hypothetical protein
MALPTSISVATFGRPVYSGITLEAYPSTNAGLSVELQQATANSTASSAWTSYLLAPTSSKSLRFTARVANSTKTWYFRARHPAQAGFSAGPFTATVMSKPAAFVPTIQLRFLPQLTYQGNVEIPAASDVWISSGKTVKVGTQVTTGIVTKTLRFGANGFVPTNNTFSYSYGIGTLTPGATGSSSVLRCVYPLSQGLKVTRFRARGRRNVAGQTLVLKLYSVTTTGGASLQTTLTFTTGAQQTVTSSALSITLGAANYLIGEADLKSTTKINEPSLVYTELDYNQGTYVQTY